MSIHDMQEKKATYLVLRFVPRVLDAKIEWTNIMFILNPNRYLQ